MDALKFDVLDMIREPDNYTSAERAQAAEVIAELIEADRELQFIRNNGCSAGAYDDAIRRHNTVLARFGGAE